MATGWMVGACVCLLAVAANVYLVRLLAHQGSMDNIVSWRPPANTMPAGLTAQDPAEPGPYRVKKLFYGAGTDVRQPEYGPSVAIKTHTVDGSDFFKDFDGWKRWARRKFDEDKLPLNARVWYPDGFGPFPLVLIVHGNHAKPCALRLLRSRVPRHLTPKSSALFA
jgi:hypothetical protein